MYSERKRLPRTLSSPASVDISITGRCNLKCRYCFYSGEMAALNDLSAEQWKRIMKKLGEARVMRATLTGGEVFARSDFFDILDSLIRNRMRYSILTNGTLIDEKTICSLSQGKRRIRMDSIQVSIDGSCADVHNRSRPDSFEGAVNGLRLLVNNGFPATSRVTLSKHNIHDIENIAKLLLDEIGLQSISTNEASPIGTGCTYREEVALDHVETLRAGLKLQDLNRKYGGRLTASAGPQARLRMYREMEDALREGDKTGRRKMGTLSSCGGVFSKMAILHDGSVTPCSMLHALSMGNALEEDLIELWRESSVIGTVRERYNVPLSSVPGCGECPWVEYCNGGCPGIVQETEGRLMTVNRRGCYRDFLEANGLESIYDVLE